jgi:hypothetical protein
VSAWEKWKTFLILLCAPVLIPYAFLLAVIARVKKWVEEDNEQKPGTPMSRNCGGVSDD